MMNVTSLGDLASSMLLRNHNSALKTEMTRLTSEVATGQVSDIPDAVQGDFRALASLDQSLARLEAYSTSTTEAAGLASAMQSALGGVQDLLSGLGADLLAAGGSGNSNQVVAVSAGAQADFETAVSYLNGQYSGRSLFAGTRIEDSALAPAEDILSELKTAISGETTVSGVVSKVEEWFQTGGGFDTAGYTGATTALADIRVEPDRSVDLSTTAQDPAIREALTGLALAALVEDGAFADGSTQQTLLAEAAGTAIVAAQSGINDLRAAVGLVEETIDQSTARISSEMTALDMARTATLQADPYESASKLQQVESQLELFYALTARSSQLSLTDYL